MIKYQGVIKANYGGDRKFPMVSPIDIAVVIAEEIQNLHSENRVKYVSSDERTGNEIASVLGKAIGKHDLKWILISNEEAQKNLESVGVKPLLAQGYVDMFNSMHKGDLVKDFYLNKPDKLGVIKLEDFAKEFATAFNK